VTSSEVDFVKSAEFQKGRKWEHNVKEILEGLGYQVFHNHQLPDLLVLKNGKACWVECKNKPRMLYHPATGFPQSNYKKYKLVRDVVKVPVLIAFNDNGEYYGNWLSSLEDHIYRENWSVKGGPIVAFHEKGFLELGGNWCYILDGKLAKEPLSGFHNGEMRS